MTPSICVSVLFLKAVRSFVSYVSSSFSESRGGTDGSRGKSIPVAAICKCVYVLLVRLSLQN